MITGDNFLSARWQGNPELTQVLAEQTTAIDPDERRQLIYEAQRLYAADLPALSLYYPTWYYAYNDRVQPFFTFQGVANGIPQPFNKLQFIEGGK